MVAWSLKCNIWSYIFLDFHEPGTIVKNLYLMLSPFHTLLFGLEKISISQFVRIL